MTLQIKEPRPNNPEEAKEYQKQTKIALQKFTERIHGFDRYQHQSAYEFYVHDVLNELLHTDTHFYLEFLKDFYIFRILGCPRLLWYQLLQDSSSIKGEKYCPLEIDLSIQFLLHSNLCDSLINNIKTIFL